MFKEGDIVRYSAKFCAPGEEKYIHRIQEINDITGHILIATLNTCLTLGSTETVTAEMIEKIDPEPTDKKEEETKMKYGEKISKTFKNIMSGETFTFQTTYKRTAYGEYHTDDEGCGLWSGDRQILGTCDFSVSGCQTEKAARAKIRKRVASL